MPEKTPHPVCPAAELPPGQRKLIDIAGRSIGVFNIDGQYYALRNACPHQNAPLCQGKLGSTTAPSEYGQYIPDREGLIIRCPWHRWEFDVATGHSVFNPHKCRVASYAVEVREAAADDASGDPVTDPATADPSVETFPVEVRDRHV